MSFTRKYKKQLLDTGLDSLKLLAIKSKDDKIEKLEPVEEIIIP